ncbi:hypothetical protein PGTUg99_031490 [Puccinia graminis f. sp. tritici]|uniref:Uncharacterized protein n=1 Tax=Puccinia graminis f. sp. tritici TaxID=56615 RepID=A0A5B0NLL0_PUCGR|nr:hypothetical protein PGTUg99_031490 [Puccinia graminis f. sp. tritici]
MHNPRDARAANNASTDIEMTSASSRRICPPVTPATEPIKAEQQRLLQQTAKEMQLALADLQELRGQVTTIEAGQLTRKEPLPVKSYASTAAKPKAPPPLLPRPKWLRPVRVSQ